MTKWNEKSEALEENLISHLTERCTCLQLYLLKVCSSYRLALNIVCFWEDSLRFIVIQQRLLQLEPDIVSDCVNSVERTVSDIFNVNNANTVNNINNVNNVNIVNIGNISTLPTS